MKKIQVSTIQMQCNAEVVVLNSYTVAKAAKAALAVREFEYFMGMNKNDFDEEHIHWDFSKEQLDYLTDYVFPFVKEFAEAFENQEESKHD